MQIIPFMRNTFLILMILYTWQTSGQQRCGTMDQGMQEEKKFESWMESKRLQNQFRISGVAEEVYTIPVVFHIIHNGEPIGVGENISEERIMEQFAILNQDFRKMNPRSSSVPALFYPIEADIGVEFILAKQDPNGFATNGIVRKQGSRSNYSNSLNTLKGESYWPAEDYINVWVAETGETIGFASFPITSLDGISESETNRLLDGLIVDDDFVGINMTTDGSFQSHGQTLTHEMGHFLGLRHIWGDSLCGNDYCDDTPQAEDDHGINGYIPVSSPCSFPGPDTCDEDEIPDMFMNFMDYTNDECMNMFTDDQKSRMRIVLENSPRRLSLRTSHALNEPIGVLDDDMAFISVDNASVVVCEMETSFDLTFANHGINNVTSFTFASAQNGVSQELIEDGLNLLTGQTHTVSLVITNLQEGVNDFSWEILQINGGADENRLNNSGAAKVFRDSETIEAPFRQDFETDTWLTASSKGQSEWETHSNDGNTSFYVKGYHNSLDNETWLISPIFSLASFQEVGMFFKMSYAIAEQTDAFRIAIQEGCDTDFSTVKSYLLDTNSFSEFNGAWVPPENGEETFVDLTSYAGQEELRLAFIFTNNGGNNFYLDDIELTNNNAPNQARLDKGDFLVYPVPVREFFQVTLNLPNAQDALIQLIDISGAVVLERKAKNALNQTFVFDTPGMYGMYFVRIRSNDLNKTQRILIGR